MTSLVNIGMSIDLSHEWNNIINYCKYHKPDLIYVAIGCSQKRYEYGKHSPQECPPFVRHWTHIGLSSNTVCILIDPDLEDDPYVLMDLTEEELAHHRIITIRRNFNWKTEATFIDSMCEFALSAPNTYMIVQDYSGTELHKYYPLQRFGSALLQKVIFDVSYMDGGCWVDFDKVRLERDMVTGAFLQPPYMPLSRAISITTPDVIYFLAERRYYTLVSYVFGYYRHPDERVWCTPETVAFKMSEICASEAYGVPISVTKENLKLLAIRMVEDFAKTADAKLSSTEIAEMLDEPTEKVLPTTVSTLRPMINELVTSAGP
jgi:hypothetical protein